ncbi:unnamed protein product, partial [Symbiodinium microadriaticum]
VFTATSQADIADDVTSEASFLPRQSQRHGHVASSFFTADQGEAQSLVEQATKQMEEVRAKQFIFNLSVNLEAVDMVLADSIVPVLRCRAELPKPGLVMYKQK